MVGWAEAHGNDLSAKPGMEWLAHPPVSGTRWRIGALLDMAHVEHALSRWNAGRGRGRHQGGCEESAGESEAGWVACPGGRGDDGSGDSDRAAPKRSGSRERHGRSVAAPARDTAREEGGDPGCRTESPAGRQLWES